jgi:hypothetical protein
MGIKYTNHAMVTLEERGIEKGLVRDLLKDPQQVVKATVGKEIAQGIFKRAGKDFLLRVVYKREREVTKVITAYWTSKIEKYWEAER